MNGAALEGAAFSLILGLGTCADGLATTPGGMAVLAGGVAVSGLLVHLTRSRAWEWGQATALEHRQRGQHIPLHRGRQRPSQGKKKAAEVVATPQRQVKQSSHATISRPYFIGAEGDCQLEFQND